jgi:hypothetical protein
MADEVYEVTTEEAVQTVADLLDRGDVRTIRVEDIDGETLVEIPGSSTSEGGVRELMDRWQDYDTGGGPTVTLHVDTAEPDELEPPHDFILEEPPEHPEEGEPRPHE